MYSANVWINMGKIISNQTHSTYYKPCFNMMKTFPEHVPFFIPSTLLLKIFLSFSGDYEYPVFCDMLFIFFRQKLALVNWKTQWEVELCALLLAVKVRRHTVSGNWCTAFSNRLSYARNGFNCYAPAICFPLLICLMEVLCLKPFIFAIFWVKKNICQIVICYRKINFWAITDFCQKLITYRPKLVKLLL